MFTWRTWTADISPEEEGNHEAVSHCSFTAPGKGRLALGGHVSVWGHRLDQSLGWEGTRGVQILLSIEGLKMKYTNKRAAKSTDVHGCFAVPVKVDS